MNLASHNSGTGERSGGLLSFLVLPFSRCQSKTLREQYEAGVRLFDIRVRRIKGKWYFAHGLWRSKKEIGYALSELNMKAFDKQEKAKLAITYEGECDFKTEFVRYVQELAKVYLWLDIVEINVKKPKWRCLRRFSQVRFTQDFVVIEGWKKLLPIPWVWSVLVVRSKEVGSKKGEYSMRDFV